MTRIFQRITANINGSVRHDRMGGREYLVVPMVMMCEGVHAGSGGPLYYPAEEMARNAEVWNHKPCVIYHPTQNGQAMSACQPDVITSRGVGVVMNNRFEDGKWKAEAWLDEERLRAVDSRVMDMVERNEMCEVSTGLFTENESKPGTWNGEEYGAIARNYGPDHLAILPDVKGACSIADGAGLMRANAAADTQNRFFSSKERRTMDLADFGDPERRAYPIRDQHDLENAARLIGHARDPEAVKRRLEEIAKRKGLKLPAAWQKKVTNTLSINAMAHGDLHGALHAKVRAMMGEDCYGAHVADVFPDSFVYTDGTGDLYRAGYKEKDGDVKVTTDPEPVVRHTEYRTLEGAYVGNATTPTTPTMGSEDMNKKEIVDQLIANGGWAEADRDWLMGLTEQRLGLVGKPTANAAKDPPPATPPAAPAVTAPPAVPPAAPVVNAGDILKAMQGMTAEQYIANAPPAIRDMLIDGLNQASLERNNLIEQLKASPNNGFSPEQLQAKPTAELRVLVRMAGAVGVAGVPDYGYRLPNFAGAAGGAPVANAVEQEALPLPVMNFETK